MGTKIKCNKCNGRGYIDKKFEGVIKTHNKCSNTYTYILTMCYKCYGAGSIDWIDELFGDDESGK